MRDYFDKICRICLDHGQLLPIFGSDRQDISADGNTPAKSCITNYSSYIAAYGRVNIRENDGYPQNICERCVSQIKAALTFRTKCQSSQDVLAKMLSIARNKKISQIHADSRFQIAMEIAVYQCHFPLKYRKSIDIVDKENRFAAISKGENTLKKNREILNCKRSIDVDIKLNDDDVKDEMSSRCSSPGFSNGEDSLDGIFDEIQTYVDRKRSQIPLPEPSTALHKPEREKRSRSEYLDPNSLLENMEKLLSGKSEGSSAKKRYPRRSPNKKTKRSSLGLRNASLRAAIRTKDFSHIMMKSMRSYKTRKEGDWVRCKVCKKLLQHSASLRYHMQIHTGFKIICEQCGKGFATEASLRYHAMTRHDAPRPFACERCDFRAARSQDLREHTRAVHTGERPYICDHCGFGFTRRNCLRMHLAHHTDVKPHKCNWCSKRYHHRADLTAHINNVHDRRYKYQCHLCEVIYAKSVTVRRHLIQHHSIARDKQGKIRRIYLK